MIRDYLKNRPGVRNEDSKIQVQLEARLASRPSKPAYFTSLRDAASSAAAPASRAAAEMYESANGQMTVASQQSALSFVYLFIIIIIIIIITCSTKEADQVTLPALIFAWLLSNPPTKQT